MTHKLKREKVRVRSTLTEEGIDIMANQTTCYSNTWYVDL